MIMFTPMSHSVIPQDLQFALAMVALITAVCVLVIITYQVTAPPRRSTMCDRWYDTQTSARSLTVAARQPQGPIYDARCGRYRDPVTKRFCKAPTAFA